MRGGLDVLLSARSLLEMESHWCQGAIARDAMGGICQVHSTKARSWDLLGALQWASLIRVDETDPDAHADAYKTVCMGLGLNPGSFAVLTDYNDAPGRKHHEILDALDKGIAIMRRRRDT